MRPAGLSAQTEAVATIPGDDMQVDVENFLPRDSSVGEMKIDAVDRKWPGAHGRRDFLRNSKDPGAVLGIQRRQSTGMTFRHNEKMT